MSDEATPRSGKIVTFYSYKGGTGRSMALANTAWVLASAGKRVLMIDWDLEAPGLQRYFHPFLDDPDLTESRGVIDWALDVAVSARLAAPAVPAAPPPSFVAPRLTAGVQVTASCVIDEPRPLLAVGTSDGRVITRDLRTGNKLSVTPVHQGAVRALGYGTSESGDCLISAGVNGEVFSGDLRSGLAPRWDRRATEPALLASAGSDGTLRLWDPGTGQELHRLTGHGGPVCSTSFSPGGAIVASAGDDGVVRLWDVVEGREQRQLTKHRGVARGVEFSPDGSYVVSAGDDRIVRLWDASSGTELRRLEGHTDWIRSVAFSPSATLVASASDDRTVRLWSTHTGKEAQRLNGHTDWVWAVAFSPDGSLLASAGDDRTVRLWNTRTGREVAKLEGHIGRVRGVAFSPDGTMLASVGEEKSTRLWHVESRREVNRLEGHTARIWSVAFSPDGDTVATSGGDGTVRIWHVASGRELMRLDGHSDDVNCVAWRRGVGTATVAAAAIERSGLTIVGTRGSVIASGDGARRRVLAIHDEIEPVSIAMVKRSDSGTVIVAAVGMAALVADDRRGDGWTDTLDHPDPVTSCGLDAAGRLIVTGDESGVVRLWDRDRIAQQVFAGEGAAVSACALSTDTGLVAAGYVDGSVRVWRLSDGELSAERAGDGLPIVSIHRVDDPEGRPTFVSIDSGGGFTVWNHGSERPADAVEPEQHWWEQFVSLMPYTVAVEHEFPGEGALHLVPAGVQDAGYAQRVTRFDWEAFYEDIGGGVLLENVKNLLREDYDYALIDSRTGISDTAGICTVQMPDDVVVCFTLNHQSIDGASGIADSIARQRRRPDGRPGVRIWPVPTRVDPGESDRLGAAREAYRERFSAHVRQLSREDRRAYWGRIETLYKPVFAYEELLAPLTEETGTSLSVLASVEELAARLEGTALTWRSPSPLERDELLQRFRRSAGESPVGLPTVYLSYPRVHQPLAAEIVDRLKAHQLDVWWDMELMLGDVLGDAIDSAMRRAFAVVVLAEGTLGAGQLSEVDAATMLEKRVVPVSVDGQLGELPFALRDRNALILPTDQTERGVAIDRMAAQLTQLAERARSSRLSNDPDDPQRGRWGGRAEAGGRRMSAIVVDRGGDWFDVTVTVERVSGAPLVEPVVFYLHPTFESSVRSVLPVGGIAQLAMSCWGAFTVGAVTDSGRVQLELDLATLPDAPAVFRER